MQSTTTTKLPENVDLMVLDASGTLREDVGLEELPDFLADKNSLVWCDIFSLHGGQNGPYGRILREVFGFDALTIEDCLRGAISPRWTSTTITCSWRFSPSTSRRRPAAFRPSRWTCTSGRTTWSVCTPGP